MAIEAKEALAYLGYDPEKIENMDKFKSEFDGNFTKNTNITKDSEVVKGILGRTFGEQELEIKKLAKANNLDLDFSSDAAGKKVTDKMSFVLSELNKSSSQTIKDLEEKAGKGNDEQLKELQGKYDTLSKEKKDVEGLLESTKTEFATAKDNWATEKKTTKLNILKEEAFSKIKFKSDISEFEKKGFSASISDKYITDLSETGSLIVTDKEGARIKSEKKTGEFKGLDEILEDEATRGGLFMLNDNGGKPAGGADKFGNKKQTNNDDDDRPRRKVADPL